MNKEVILAKTLFNVIYDKLTKVTEIQSTYSDNEVRNIVYLLIEHISGASKTDVIINKTVKWSGKKSEQLDDAVQRVINLEPVQYITREAYFYGKKFLVSPQVLIPRRETEELVHLIITENQAKKPKILDIGTGSGCIPIVLKKEIKRAEIYAIDISEKALEVAKHNAKSYKAKIDFSQEDICSKNFLAKRKERNFYHFDIIVSNPPYVRKSEAKKMCKNVLEYEPHLALFVTDKDPLLFYREIISIINESKNSELHLLKKGGKLFFEVNESFAKEVASLLEMNNFVEIRVRKYMQNKNRFVTGRRSL